MITKFEWVESGFQCALSPNMYQRGDRGWVFEHELFRFHGWIMAEYETDAGGITPEEAEVYTELAKIKLATTALQP